MTENIRVCLKCEKRLVGELWHGPSCRCQIPIVGQLGQLEAKLQLTQDQVLLLRKLWRHESIAANDHGESFQAYLARTALTGFTYSLAWAARHEALLGGQLPLSQEEDSARSKAFAEAKKLAAELRREVDVWQYYERITDSFHWAVNPDHPSASWVWLASITG